MTPVSFWALLALSAALAFLLAAAVTLLHMALARRQSRRRRGFSVE